MFLFTERENCHDFAADCAVFNEMGGCDEELGDNVYALEQCCGTCNRSSKLAAATAGNRY